MKKKPGGPSETVHVSAFLALPLYSRLRHAAVDDRRAASELIRDALMEYLDRREKAIKKGGAR